VEVIRLIIEFAFFALAAYAMYSSGMQIWPWYSLSLLLFIMPISLDRIRWLLSLKKQ
jgi:hypothetical protein